MSNAATALLNTENLVAVFNSNEGAVTGFLAATADGSDLLTALSTVIWSLLDSTRARQKAAVRNGWFIGSVTQDPYNIGYKAVELAAKAAKERQLRMSIPAPSGITLRILTTRISHCSYTTEKKQSNTLFRAPVFREP